MIRTGVDLIEIERVEAAVARHGDRFLARVYTETERAQCGNRIESLAARFAAKEAAGKALGSGIWRNGVLWTDIEIVRNEETGAPTLELHGAAEALAADARLGEWSVSLSHDKTHAIAFVVALGSS